MLSTRKADELLGIDVGEAEGLHTTEKALLVRFEGEKEWIPKSHLHADSEVKRAGQKGILIVSPWFAAKRRWGKFRFYGPEPQQGLPFDVVKCAP